MEIATIFLYKSRWLTRGMCDYGREVMSRLSGCISALHVPSSGSSSLHFDKQRGDEDVLNFKLAVRKEKEEGKIWLI